MKINRFIKHWGLSVLPVRMTISSMDLAGIERAIEDAEKKTSAEFLVIFERSLPISYLKRNDSCRTRARTLFGKYGCWDTGENNGVLIYINLTERAIEIFLDRAAARVIPISELDKTLLIMRDQFQKKHYMLGVQEAVVHLSELLSPVFPNRENAENSVSNQPVVI